MFVGCLAGLGDPGWIRFFGGLIRSQKVGRTRTCSINPVALRSAEDWIADRRTMVERRLDRLGEYLARTAGKPDTAWATESGETTNDHEEQQ